MVYYLRMTVGIDQTWVIVPVLFTLYPHLNIADPNVSTMEAMYIAYMTLVGLGITKFLLILYDLGSWNPDVENRVFVYNGSSRNCGPSVRSVCLA